MKTLTKFMNNKCHYCTSQTNLLKFAIDCKYRFIDRTILKNWLSVLKLEQFTFKYIPKYIENFPKLHPKN